MRFLRRSLVGLFLLSVTLGVLAYAGQMIYGAVQARLSDEPPERPARERVFAVNTVTVTPETITPVMTVFGEVRSRRTLELRASAGGTIVELSENFEEGGEVAAGELLLRIDPTDAQSALDTAETSLAEAEAEVAEATRAVTLAEDDVAAAEEQLQLRTQALDRQRDLVTRGVGTEAAVETAALAASSARQSLVSRRQAMATAMARVDGARTALRRQEIAVNEAQRRVAETEVFAEFAGTLSGVTAVEGGIVTANEQLASLIDPNALEVAFRVSTSQYSRLLDGDGRLIGAPVVAGLDVLGVDLTATGTISREGAAVGTGQTGRQIFARLDDAQGFRPGDFVTVRIEEPPLERVASLPATAVDAAGTVLVVGEDDRLEVAQTEVLRRQGDAVVVSAAGLAGRQAVRERTPLLGAGIKVRVVNPPEAGDAPQPVNDLVELTEERRARLVAFVEGNSFMPDEAKKRVLAQLSQDRVPVRTVERIESRMGG
ncbi:efflux RND transporter periplasmic adaptor subunit [Anianabacter salinae]|uniref:efflux RND transporter periplasmic adaptor subunit n=1 Tax=Anianabacter salinae TaxID=2851023 RepID=UPI00225E118A|nr:HlyD family efflux transporter periplasmic adaptor subunit [Anianabacter salinae]MBV0910845.1 HlyD family efflux transporter periplasmic adaptor subunit [Anianabacter salinae]